MLRIEMLPASYGDSLWVEYGSPDRSHRVLIDGGLAGTARLLERRLGTKSAPLELDLLVVTHIDADHIAGILALLDEHADRLRPGDVWFNGPDHLDPDGLGVYQGEVLSRRLDQLRWPWNRAFDGGAVVVPQHGPLPIVRLPGGATLTLLSPDAERLRRLRRAWNREIPKLEKRLEALDRLGGEDESEEEGAASPSVDVEALAAEPFEEDDAVANGSSIAFLFEYGGWTCLFSGDAFPSVLLGALARVESLPDRLDVFKLPHHGSKGNLSRELVARLPAAHYLVSTNGKRFNHPDDASIARILTGDLAPKILCFNYRTPRNEHWSSADLQSCHAYEARYAAPGASLVLDFDET